VRLVDARTARRAWRVLEPLHSMVYFVPERNLEYGSIGVTDQTMGYFGSRAAPMGAVGAEIVVATFFNFSPDLVRRFVPAVWEIASPAALLAARLRVVETALPRAIAPEVLASEEMAELASLARRAAEGAAGHPEGRTLFAAHAALEWPDVPFLALWHAQSLLREFRGDAHVASLLLEGLDPVEALVSHAAYDPSIASFLRRSRAWSEEDWGAGAERLRSRGLLEAGPDLSFTDAGREQRERIEAQTDAATLPAYEPLGEEGCERVRELGRPLSVAVVEAGMLKADVWGFASGS
jgi:hypothetical protein